MEDLTRIKAIVVSVCSLISGLLGAVSVPIFLMILSSVIDWITGCLAAPYREDGGIVSDKSQHGIKRKVLLWMLCPVGMIMDELLAYTSALIGIDLHIRFLIASAVCLWVCANEIISILENMSDANIPIPKFITPLANKIKVVIENEAGKKEGEADE